MIRFWFVLQHWDWGYHTWLPACGLTTASSSAVLLQQGMQENAASKLGRAAAEAGTVGLDGQSERQGESSSRALAAMDQPIWVSDWTGPLQFATKTTSAVDKIMYKSKLSSQLSFVLIYQSFSEWSSLTANVDRWSTRNQCLGSWQSWV